jgi:vancomycin resistance protein YoaR
MAETRIAILAPVMLLLMLALGGALCARLMSLPPTQTQLAGYSTSLKGRTSNQRHNARLAAQALDGRIVAPGATFSFNRTVQSWSLDQGYVKALVSYDGELVRAFGGGVCQTSTTLYNAALLAGLPIVERHPHVFVPGYIRPGRDAAVAYPGVDLRFRNPHPWPVRIRAVVRGDRLEIVLQGAQKPRSGVHVVSDALAVTTPGHVVRVRSRGAISAGRGGRSFLRSVGATGYRVVTYRTFFNDKGETRRERLSDDTYPAMNRVLFFVRDGN